MTSTQKQALRMMASVGAGNTPFRRWKRGDLSRRHQRSLHRPLAQRHQGEGEFCPSSPTPSTWFLQCSRRWASSRPPPSRGNPVADPGPELCPCFRSTQRHPRNTSPSTSRCSGTGLCITTAGARCALAGTSFNESGLPFGAPIDYDKLTELDAKGWELYHLETDYAENHNLAADNRAN